MTNMYTQANKQQRIVESVGDAANSPGMWLLDLLGGFVAILFCWR